MMKILALLTLLVTLSYSAPQSFNNISPSNFSFDVDVSPTFSWTEATDTEEVVYTLQFGSSPSFEIGSYQELNSLRNTSYSPSIDLNRGQLIHWRVMAINVSGDTTYSNQFNSPWQFQTISNSTTPQINSADTIKNSRTLIRENSPYEINGMIEIDSMATLLINPGVELHFTDVHSGLNVHGELIAQGTLTDTIRFKANALNEQPGQWKGIIFSDKASPSQTTNDSIYVSGSVLKFVEIMNAGSDQTIQGALTTYVPLLVQNFNIHHNAKSGVYAPGVGFFSQGQSHNNIENGFIGGLNLHTVELTDNSLSGLQLIGDQDISLKHVTSVNNSWTGIFGETFEHNLIGSHLIINDNTHAGIITQSNQFSLVNSEVNHNGGRGLYAKTHGSASMENVDVFSNGNLGSSTSDLIDDGSSSTYDSTLFDGNPFRSTDVNCVLEYCLVLNRSDEVELFRRSGAISFYLKTSESIAETDTLYLEWHSLDSFRWHTLKTFTGKIPQSQFHTINFSSIGPGTRLRFRRVGSGQPHYVSQVGYRNKINEGIRFESSSSNPGLLMFNNVHADTNRSTANSGTNLMIEGDYQIEIQASSFMFSNFGAKINTTKAANISTSIFNNNMNDALTLTTHLGGILNDLELKNNNSTALTLTGDSIRLKSSDISYNSDPSSSAAIILNGSHALIESNNISHNSLVFTGIGYNNEVYYGGAINLQGDSIYIHDNTINNNSLEVDNTHNSYQFTARGGAMSLSGHGYYSIHNNNFENNSAKSGNSNTLGLGGVITNGYVWSPQVDLVGNTFKGNSAGWKGSVYYNHNNGLVRLDSNIFIDNTSDQNNGYALYLKSVSMDSIVGNVFSNNNSGGMYINTSASDMSIISNTFTDHSGGYALEGQYHKLSQNIIANNSAGGFKGHADSLTYNDIYDHDTLAIYNTLNLDMDARNNWWGTRSDQGLIANILYDAVDEPGNLGTIFYSPFLANSSSNIPGPFNELDSIEIKGDSNFTQQANGLSITDTHYLQLFGSDSNAYAKNFSNLIIRNTNNNNSISIIMKESENTSGDTRGYFNFGSNTDLSSNTLSANPGDSIYIYSTIDPSVNYGFVIGELTVNLNQQPQENPFIWKLKPEGLHFTSSKSQNIQWSVWNHKGQDIFHTHINHTPGSNTYVWPKTLKSGFYIIRLQIQQQVYTQTYLLP